MQSCCDIRSELCPSSSLRMMNNCDNTLFLTVHRISDDGSMISYQYEEDFHTRAVVGKTLLSSENFNNCSKWMYPTIDDKVNLRYRYVNESDEQAVTVVKVGGIEDLAPSNYTEAINVAFHDSSEGMCANDLVDAKIKRENRIPNIPTMVRCQNCDTNFPTKYQYQRHQCEFNADKVVLKADADIKDIDKGMRIKYDCITCGKQFVSKNNLDRHQSSHENMQANVCEHCNKQFVSENRLRIHKENHCKKAGDISKFYRSDVTVWKCIKCNQVFATPASANRHADECMEVPNVVQVKAESSSFAEDNSELNLLKQEIQNLSNVAPEILTGEYISMGNVNANNTEMPLTNVEKVLTELLLQCEYCNRTYSDRDILLKHQKKHTTSVNYECVTCRESFESYTAATKHWMTKCSDEANLFYLPKMTYCECCDRTFKSHEMLYTHKIKKKHYTTKVHVTEDNAKVLQSQDNILVKLIEDVLTSMNKDKDDKEKNKENEMPNKECQEIAIAKDEDDLKDVTPENHQPEKKKRGRKRKWPKQTSKAKRMSYSVQDGYKYQCERCIEVFDIMGDLELHRDKEHASNFSCEECGQVVHSAKALIIHCRAHQSLKPYVCEQCGRSYSQTSHLWQHMRFHQGIKPFACPHEGCEARYTIRPDLKDHIRKVHTRERPFKCQVCNKCFLTGSVYYQHRLIHTNDRRYGCDICEKRFFRADALNNHRRIHTDERPYPCDKCGREFRQKGDRNKHVRTQHPE